MICLTRFTLEYLNSEVASFPNKHMHSADKPQVGNSSENVTSASSSSRVKEDLKRNDTKRVV